jgi:hypothetical protein
MSDSYVQFPYTTLNWIGQALTSVHSDLGHHDHAAYSVDGLSDHQSHIHSAIDGFRNEWKYSVDKLGENIGSFGELSSQIGTMVGQFDEKAGEAMRPKTS